MPGPPELSTAQCMTSDPQFSDDKRLRRALHGRRVGRPIRQAQAGLLANELSGLRLDLSAAPPMSLVQLFEVEVRDVWLEIGFGAGEHLLYQAQQNPEVGIIGCEPFLNGVVKVVRGIQEAEAKAVRLYDDDANHVLDWLPEASLGRVFVLFPDPWPKKRHRKRRFLTEVGLERLARVMRSGAELRFATDIADYAEMVCEGIAATSDFAAAPGLLEQRLAEWPLTRYAEKAVAAGRDCQFFIFTRI